METHRVPSVSQPISFDVRACKQQGVPAHGTGAFKTVASVSHAAESAVLGTAATTGRFQSGIGHIVINEIFHPGSPWSVAHDAVLAVHDSVLSRVAADHPRDEGVFLPCLGDVVHV